MGFFIKSVNLLEKEELHPGNHGTTIDSRNKKEESTNMENVTNLNKLESIKSFQSSIRKSEKASTQMMQKGANTTLIRKRLKALRIGLAMLEYVWNQRPHHYNLKELAETRYVLNGLLPSIESIWAKSKVGSSQKTLLERRIKAFKLAVQAIDDISNGEW